MKHPISKTTLAAGVAASVSLILASVFSLEGGHVDHPADPGGETNHGITQAVAIAHGYTGPMADLPKEKAEDIYLNAYIAQPGFLPLVELSKPVSHKVIDAGVNAGTYRSSVWLQKALNALNRNQKDYKDIVVDGKIGPATINAYVSLVQVRGKVRACQMIIKLLDAQQAMHYLSLTNLEVFTPGWIANRIGNVPVDDCRH